MPVAAPAAVSCKIFLSAYGAINVPLGIVLALNTDNVLKALCAVEP